MPSSKFLQRALKIVKEHPQVFEALEEYDKTGKLPKTIYRERVNFTIEATILRKFKAHARERGLNMSRIIEKHIQEELGIRPAPK